MDITSVARSAESFLAPVRSKKSNQQDLSGSLVDLLSAHLPEVRDTDRRRAVTKHALELTLSLHHHALHAPSQGQSSTSDLIQTVYGLLDVIDFLGIIPSLSKGIMLHPEHQRKSILAPSLITRSLEDPPSQDYELLAVVVDGFSRILRDGERGIAILLQDHLLPDFVCGVAELAFSPVISPSARDEAGRKWDEVLKLIHTPALMPLLTALLQPSAPDWFRTPISEVLSLLPLREYGVRQVIEFIAASYPGSNPQEQQSADRSSRRRGPMLSLEAIDQSAKLLSSVPKSMTPESYFTRIAPQLLDVLDGSIDQEMSEAVAHVVSRILGRKTTGSPGSIGWVLFVEPIYEALNPGTNTSKKEQQGHPGTIVSESELMIALRRLHLLVTSRPNPGLSKRLLGPLLMPLWGLLCFSRSLHVGSWWSDVSLRLIGDRLRGTTAGPDLHKFAKSILWDGTSLWTFGPGSEGGVEVRHRTEERPMLEVLSEVDNRVTTFIELMASEHVDSETVGAVFLGLVKGWLFPLRDKEASNSSLISPEDDPLQLVVVVKLVQSMLQRLEARITANAEQMIELVQQLLEKHVTTARAAPERRSADTKPTYADLGRIVDSQGDSSSTNRARAMMREVDDSESTSIALSVLKALLASDLKITPAIRNMGENILSNLKLVTDDLRKVKASPTLVRSAQEAEVQLMSMLHPDQLATSQERSSKLAKDRQALEQTLQEFTSTETPGRVQAILAIQSLIDASSPAVDVPVMASFLLRHGITDNDEYVFLSVIRTLGSLSALDPQLVTGLVVDSFVDRHEEGEHGLDGRLRTGEALSSIVETLTAMAVHEGQEPIVTTAFKRLYDGLMHVAGRRGQRPRAFDSRKKRQRLERMRRDKDQRKKNLITELGEVDEDDEKLDPAELRLLEQIISGWEDTGLEEDVRIRTSALGLLGQTLEKALPVFVEADIEQAVDLALAVLAIEVEPEKAILRRAAAVLFHSILKAMDSTRTVVMTALKWEHIESTLRWMGDTDDDELVKGHIRTALEELESWKMNALLAQQELPRELELRSLRGLQVDPEGESRAKKIGIEELE